jgi:hypothetical protein
MQGERQNLRRIGESVSSPTDWLVQLVSAYIYPSLAESFGVAKPPIVTDLTQSDLLGTIETR